MTPVLTCDSVVQDLYRGVLRDRLSCPMCRKQFWITDDTFWGRVPCECPRCGFNAQLDLSELADFGQ
jgi:hypothetical protein